MKHHRPSGGGALRHRLWICKPRGGYNSVGIHMHSLPTEELAVDVDVDVDVAVAVDMRSLPIEELPARGFSSEPLFSK